MPWTKFVVPERQSTTSGTGLKVTLSKRGVDKPAKLLMTFSAVLAAQFGWAGDEKLEVLIGDGAQQGFVRLRKNNSAGGSAVLEEKTSAIGSKAKYYKLVLGTIPGMIDRAEAARWSTFEAIADGGWTEVRLPSWAFPETRPARSMAEIASEAANFQRPRRDAAPGMMGDPPAGRSALAARKTA